MWTSYTLSKEKTTLRTWFEEMQAIVTVCAGILSEIPAPRAASLAMFDVFTSWITVPTQTYSINLGSTPVLFNKPTWRKIMEPNAIHKGFTHFLLNKIKENKSNYIEHSIKTPVKKRIQTFKIWKMNKDPANCLNIYLSKINSLFLKKYCKKLNNFQKRKNKKNHANLLVSKATQTKDMRVKCSIVN